MLKKAVSLILCTTAIAASFGSCGKEIEVSTTANGNSSVSGNSSESSSETDTQDTNVKAANFTAPKDGEQIVVMNIKNYGEVKIKLFPEYADKGVENFVELAKKGYYDGLTFHRVINDFMIQGGDPTGTGRGGECIWGNKFDGGTDPHLIHTTGALAYANSGATSTNGSQFYIVTGTLYDEQSLADMGAYYGISFSDSAKELYTTVGGTPWLDGGYTVFGQVFDGLDVIFEIQKVTTDQGNNKPIEDVVMESVKVEEYDGDELRWYITDYKD